MGVAVAETPSAPTTIATILLAPSPPPPSPPPPPPPPPSPPPYQTSVCGCTRLTDGAAASTSGVCKKQMSGPTGVVECRSLNGGICPSDMSPCYPNPTVVHEGGYTPILPQQPTQSCFDQKPVKKCRKKVTKNKCHKRGARKKCRMSCGVCVASAYDPNLFG